ncbi:TIGR04255 family protein [Dactylosporangium sp. NPDC000244]|uniref:TIGR04255 family protein n=1 Tax=Dactylosporangium sp. NPDC000244 TaxID=3154365 RepID=UPI0033341AC8
MLRSVERAAATMADGALSYVRSPDLPYFEEPPVREVSVVIQFQALPLRAVDLGDLRDRLRGRYPTVHERPPAPSQVENFRSSLNSQLRVQFTLADRVPIPMLIFVSEDESSIIQVQSDRFACAWRRTETVKYPRYERIREETVRLLELFSEFVEAACDGEDIKVTQAEVAYVNTIPVGDQGRPDVLANAVPDHARDTTLPVISSTIASYSLTFQNANKVEYARLHMKGEPDLEASEPTVLLTLLYRGEPYERSSEPPGLDTLLAFVDEGHEQIVRAFAQNTTPDAQRLWRRIV